MIGRAIYLDDITPCFRIQNGGKQYGVRFLPVIRPITAAHCHRAIDINMAKFNVIP